MLEVHTGSTVFYFVCCSDIHAKHELVSSPSCGIKVKTLQIYNFALFSAFRNGKSCHSSPVLMFSIKITADYKSFTTVLNEGSVLSGYIVERK